jgi:hypothetical protein
MGHAAAQRLGADVPERRPSRTLCDAYRILLGPAPIDLPQENCACRASIGQTLHYAGGISEAEILITLHQHARDREPDGDARAPSRCTHHGTLLRERTNR